MGSASHGIVRTTLHVYDYVTTRAYEYNMAERFAETCWEDNDNEVSRTATDHSSDSEDEVQVKVLQQGVTLFQLWCFLYLGLPMQVHMPASEQVPMQGKSAVLYISVFV